ncbi:MAG TPA: PIN domain-containing protein [Methylotenera sp.]|nr:PIN domain-containing protein [Methylotenera sp.]HPH05027.1 PIN domain-containing protein [Methylotenera sp.]HPN00289.1 PIN domain-containing protein [Methylotenera sp.]
MTKSDAATAMLVDASVLVAVFSDEPRSTVVRQRWKTISLKYTTPFCYFEAMNILKSKWKFQQKLNRDSYRKACSSLTAWFGGATRAGWVQDKDFLEPVHFQRVRALVDRTGLDFSDAFQLDSIKFGYFSVLSGDSRVILATTDAELAKIAKLERVRVWNIELEDVPEN